MSKRSMKRSRPAKRANGSRTGGTGDVKPQYLTVRSSVSAAADYGINQFSLPVPRFGSQQGRTTVVEILSLDWYIGMEDQADASDLKWAYLTTATARTQAETSTLVTCVEDCADPLTFGLVMMSVAGNAQDVRPVHYDLTDNNGNGMVVATDKLFIVHGDAGGTANSSSICKIKYRLVNIGMKEYIGIVQSQQA